MVTKFSAAVLVGTLLSGCYMGAEQVINAEVAAPAGAEQAVEMVWKALGCGPDTDCDYLPPIHWVEGPCILPMTAGKCQGGRVLAGGPFGKGEIYIVVQESSTSLSRTSLAHELLHSMLGQRTGNSDHNHTGPEWTDLLRGLNDDLRAAGL